MNGPVDVIALIAALAIAFPAGTARAQAEASEPPLPPPGRMVDLGGWRVHLHCTGQASDSTPTVVLEAGAGGFSVDWSLVQPESAGSARVCSYDRSGLGWSELGPRPRTLRQVAWELHTLLERAGERAPFLLVGHSYGGILARQYVFTYPEEVVAIVFSESGHEEGTVVLRGDQMVRLVETATGAAVPLPRTSGPLRESELPPAIRQQIEAAARAMAPRANDPPRNLLPPDAQRMRAWAFAQVKHWATNDNLFEGEELAVQLDRWRGKPYPLGDLPVLVLSRGRAGSDAEVEAEHRRNQAELVGLSRSTRQIIAQRSGHEIHIDEPEVVVGAVRELLARVRR
jgi:pimeloyl-ACP methyl ester carboxylesterase